MSACKSCGWALEFKSVLCRKCGAITLSDTGSIGGVSKGKTTTLDQVSATTVARVNIGPPWDDIFGGGQGLVPTSTTLVGGAPGAGKRLCLTTPLPTPTGWTTMGDVKVGDELFDELGQPCRVTHVTEPVIAEDCVELEFSDGETIVADSEHLWHTRTKAERAQGYRRSEDYRVCRRAARAPRGVGLRQRKVPGYNPNLARWRATVNVDGEVRTTKQIVETLRTGAHANHSITRTEPLVLPDRALPIPPYVLGVWLGDGTSAEGHYTNLDEEIGERVRAAGYTVDRYDYPNRTPRWVVRGLRQQLRRLGVLNNKHIPQAYLRASVEQRLELVRGLLDTDGTVTKSGGCNFDTTREQLRDGMSELLASLGIRSAWSKKVARLHGKACGFNWRFEFRTHLQVFHLPRKGAKQRAPQRDMDRERYIVAARRVAPRAMRCIAVDSPSHLYLAGRGMIPTHNTTAFLQILSKLAELTGKRAYYLSAEQGPGDLRITAERLKIPNIDRFRVLSEFGVGAEIDEELLKEDPPAGMVVDSVSALVGKDTHAAVAIAKRYKKLSVTWGAPSFLVCHMTKEHDYAGLMALQHEVDTLITLFPEDDGRRHAKAWKNRYGPTHAEYFLVMTELGLMPATAPPSEEDEDEKDERAGGRVTVSVPAELEDLDEEDEEGDDEEEEAPKRAPAFSRERREERARAAAEKPTKRRTRLSTEPLTAKVAEHVARAVARRNDVEKRAVARRKDKPAEIEVRGQRLVLKKTRKPPETARARAIEGEAKKRGRPALPRTREGKEEAKKRRRTEAAAAKKRKGRGKEAHA